MKSSMHTRLNLKRICVYLLLLGCIFSFPSLNKFVSGTEMTLTIPVESSSGIPDGEEGTHAAKDIHSSVLSTKSRQNPGRPVPITSQTGSIARPHNSDANNLSGPATPLVRPTYYAFLFRYNLF